MDPRWPLPGSWPGLLLILLVIGLLLPACTPAPDLYGKPASIKHLEQQAAPLRTLSVGAPAVVRGQLGEVCKMGCWFYLLGDSGLRRVELDLSSGFVIPPDSAGREALVAGSLTAEGPEGRIVAETVVLYPR